MRIKTFRYIAIIIAAALLTGCHTVKSDPKDTANEMTMYIATDIHYLAKNLYVNGGSFTDYLNASDGKMMNYTDEIMQAFSNDISKNIPDILIISGDLTNNGEKASHLKLAERFTEIEQKTGTRVYVIPGNHDILNPWARGFTETEQYITDTVSAEDFEKIYDSFGYDEAISRDQSSLSYLAAPSDDIWLLMLDTNIYDFNELLGAPTTNGEIQSETLKWIKECSQLAEDNNAKIVTVMHHNLFDHNQVLNKGFTLDNNDEVQKVFQEFGLQLILSGHIHIQDIKSTAQERKQIYDIATSALSVYPVQYGVLRFDPARGFDYCTEQVDVSGWAKASGNSDENLINFDEYSKNFFADLSFNKAYEELTEAGIYSEYEKKIMAETMSLLNIHYFSGTTSAIKQDVMESEGYQLWLEATEPEFLKNYILSMVSGSSTNNNHWNSIHRLGLLR
jgi:3',5'-cyclic AMP phosphodiesterase CpdA